MLIQITDEGQPIAEVPSGTILQVEDVLPPCAVFPSALSFIHPLDGQEVTLFRPEYRVYMRKLNI